MRATPSLLAVALIAAAGLTACGGKQTQPQTQTAQCTACHGDATRAGTALQQAAPPKDAHGATDATLVTVGAHQAHVYGGVACATCHQIPADGDLTHAAEPHAWVVFSGNLVGANGTPVAPWNRNQPTCANYCHNPGMGASVPTPSWTRAAALDCGACHWNQQTEVTSTGLHADHVLGLPDGSRFECGACHGDGYSRAGVSGAALATHLDGSLQILPLVGWQDPRCAGPRTCYASCHATPGCRYWP